MRAGNGFRFLDAAEFPFVGTVVDESLPVNYFYGPVRSQSIPREPDFPVAAATDLADEFVIGNICGGNPACKSGLRKILRLVWGHGSSPVLCPLCQAVNPKRLYSPGDESPS